MLNILQLTINDDCGGTSKQASFIIDVNEVDEIKLKCVVTIDSIFRVILKQNNYESQQNSDYKSALVHLFA